MPTINDATVVASAYDTSGNGGRKLVKLDNGWLVSVLKASATNLIVYVSKDNFATTPTVLCNIDVGGVSLVSPSIVNYKNNVYITVSSGSDRTLGWKIDALTQTNVNIGANFFAIDTVQTGFSGNALITNETGTELHATWSSKNATYANSFNIRYAKGTIATDGSVAWGVVEQVTTVNTTGNNVLNPSLITRNGQVGIAVEYAYTSANTIIYLTKEFTTKAYLTGTTKADWGNTLVIPTIATYAQSSPQAIFVPQSVNGLASGRMWVAWHGVDSGSNSTNQIRVSYSDDGGITWSTSVRLTSDTTKQMYFPSITANKNGKVFILFEDRGGDGWSKISKLTYDGTWSGSVVIKSATSADVRYPSALFDLTVNFTEPLFIYKDTAKVGFYGTWTVTTISVTQGSIGQKTDKANVLTYAITTDGTMSTITEKVNGVTIGMKTATSGQSLIAGLTQAQWDAVKFGKYKDATGGLNTLTVEMGSEKFTYTFDKRLATDADVLSAVKAVQDADSVATPAKKALLGTAIRAKGGTVNDTDALEVMASAVSNMVVPKKASGSVTNTTATITAYDDAGGSFTSPYVTVTGLSFQPKTIAITLTTDGSQTTSGSVDGMPKMTGYNIFTKTGTPAKYRMGQGGVVITANGFTLPVTLGGYSYTWIAIE